jgi:hypothetical protein
VKSLRTRQCLRKENRKVVCFRKVHMSMSESEDKKHKKDRALYQGTTPAEEEEEEREMKEQ